MGMGGKRLGPANLHPGMTRYPLYSGLGGTQVRPGRVKKFSPPPGFDPRPDQPVASRYTDWAIPAHAKEKRKEKKTSGNKKEDESGIYTSDF